MPEVSIIMSVYKSPFLEESVNSILCQTFEDFEFIIVNDGCGQARHILDQYNDSRLRVVDNRKNIGLTKSLNRALDFARGAIIARQDADDVSLPRRLEEQLPYLRNNIAMVGCWAITIDEFGKTIRDPWTDKVTRSNKAQMLAYLADSTNPIVHTGVILTRKAINKIGYFDPVMRYAQDYNYWLRLIPHFDFEVVPKPLVKKRLHPRTIWMRYQPVEYLELAAQRALTHPHIPPITL